MLQFKRLNVEMMKSWILSFSRVPYTRFTRNGAKEEPLRYSYLKDKRLFEEKMDRDEP